MLLDDHGIYAIRNCGLISKLKLENISTRWRWSCCHVDTSFLFC